MAEGGDTFPDAKLQGLARGVCKIEVTDSSGDGFVGTGFHYGGGWVMSVAHNFQDDDRDHSKIHSMIKTAKFTFCTEPGPVIDADGAKVIELTAENSVVFNPQERMAFIHHLEPGEDVDIKNEDIAMIKLGHQWEYMREEKYYEDWEIREQDSLNTNRLSAFVSINIDKDKWEEQVEKSYGPSGEDELRSIPIIEPNVNEVYAMHFGGDDDHMKLVRSRVIKKTERSTNKDGSIKNVPLLHLDKPGENCPFPGGSSGCPVLTKPEETGKYGLVGLHFAGDDDDKDGTAKALPWTAIQKYINNGVTIIQDVDKQLGNKAAISAMGNWPGDIRQKAQEAQEAANDARERLLGSADKNKLTIYLPTGVVLTV